MQGRACVPVFKAVAQAWTGPPAGQGRHGWGLGGVAGGCVTAPVLKVGIGKPPGAGAGQRVGMGKLQGCWGLASANLTKCCSYPPHTPTGA